MIHPPGDDFNITSDNPEVVSIDGDNRAAYLRAVAAGHATIRYYPITLADKTGKPNQGFIVTVIAAHKQ